MGRATVDEGAAGGDARLGRLLEEYGACETVRTQYVPNAHVFLALVEEFSNR